MFFWEREYREARAEYRHPGHEDQSVHGKWAHGIKKGPAPGQGIPMSREDIMAARYSTLPERTQLRAVPEGGHGMVSPDGEFMVVDREGVATPEQVKMVYDHVEGLAAKYGGTATLHAPGAPAGGRAAAVNIMSDEVFNRTFAGADSGTGYGASQALANTDLRTGVINMKASALTTRTIAEGGFLSPAGAGHPVTEYVLTHEYGHVLTGDMVGATALGSNIPPASKYGAASPWENAAEHFASFHYGGTDYGTQKAAEVWGWTETRSRFFDAEYRHPGHDDQKVHGSWARGRLDAQEFGDLPPAAQTAFLEACEKRGIDMDGMANELDTVLANDPSLLERGATWYPSANKVAQEMSEKSGMTLEQSAGVISALSPQKEWDSSDGALGNMELALLMASHPSAFAHVTDKDSALETMRVLAPQVTGKSSAVLGSNVWNAVRIMHGEPVDTVLNPNGSLKTRSFVNNILQPGATSSVTVDAHMSKLLMTGGSLGVVKSVTSAMNAKINQAKTTGLNIKSIGYIAVSKVVQDYARAHDLSPDVVQAAYWLYAKEEVAWVR